MLGFLGDALGCTFSSPTLGTDGTVGAFNCGAFGELILLLITCGKLQKKKIIPC